MQRDLNKFTASFQKSFDAQIAMFPAMMNKKNRACNRSTQKSDIGT